MSERVEAKKTGGSRRITTVLVSSELLEYARSVPLNLSAILELALLRHYRKHVDPKYMTRYALWLKARYLAGDPEMKRLEIFFRDLGVYSPY